MTSGAETQLLSVDERVAGGGGLTSSPGPLSVVGVVKISLLVYLVSRLFRYETDGPLVFNVICSIVHTLLLCLEFWIGDQVRDVDQWTLFLTATVFYTCMYECMKTWIPTTILVEFFLYFQLSTIKFCNHYSSCIALPYIVYSEGVGLIACALFCSRISFKCVMFFCFVFFLESIIPTGASI